MVTQTLSLVHNDPFWEPAGNRPSSPLHSYAARNPDEHDADLMLYDSTDTGDTCWTAILHGCPADHLVVSATPDERLICTADPDDHPMDYPKCLSGASPDNHSALRTAEEAVREAVH